MKRGRPPLREQFRQDILSALSAYQYPATVSTVKRLLNQRRLQPCAWETVEKYLNELSQQRLVLRQALPTERGRKPLVIFVGRNPPIDISRQFCETSSED
jgi:hypothetical protein